MRVISGKYRSRPLRSLRGADVRPTSDRLRETLFDVLTAGNPGALTDSVWVDLFAGSGAVGIEAMSRGAAMVYFVENSPPAAELIQENLRSLTVDTGFKVIRHEAEVAVHRLETDGVRADFVFLDPPYQSKAAYGNVLEALGRSAMVKPATLIMAEHLKKYDPGESFGLLRRHRTLKQGDAALSFYRLA